MTEKNEKKHPATRSLEQLLQAINEEVSLAANYANLIRALLKVLTEQSEETRQFRSRVEADLENCRSQLAEQAEWKEAFEFDIRRFREQLSKLETMSTMRDRKVTSLENRISRQEGGLGRRIE